MKSGAPVRSSQSPRLKGHRMNSDEQFIVPGGRLSEFFKLKNIG